MGCGGGIRGDHEAKGFAGHDGEGLVLACIDCTRGIDLE